MKVVHLAALISEHGGVSAACFNRPRKIDLAKELWTICVELVSCDKCKATDRFRNKSALESLPEVKEPQAANEKEASEK